MEANVAEAVMNDVLGTENVVMLCARYNVEHFALISTDKAVRPSSVMGAWMPRSASSSTSSMIAARLDRVDM